MLDKHFLTSALRISLSSSSMNAWTSPRSKYTSCSSSSCSSSSSSSPLSWGLSHLRGRLSRAHWASLVAGTGGGSCMGRCGEDPSAAAAAAEATEWGIRKGSETPVLVGQAWLLLGVFIYGIPQNRKYVYIESSRHPQSVARPKTGHLQEE